MPRRCAGARGPGASGDAGVLDSGSPGYAHRSVEGAAGRVGRQIIYPVSVNAFSSTGYSTLDPMTARSLGVRSKMIILVGWVITEGPRTFKSHPQSAPGDFYVVNGECISCGAPHAVAPDLIGWAADSEYEHCIWKKQPETQQEMEQAFDASQRLAFRVTDTPEQIVASWRELGSSTAIMRPVRRPSSMPTTSRQTSNSHYKPAVRGDCAP